MTMTIEAARLSKWFFKNNCKSC